MDDAWYGEKLQNLRIKENRLTALTEIKGRLDEESLAERTFSERLLRAPELYECLEDSNVNGNNSEQLELATDILAICMSNLSVQQNNLPHLLQRALVHQRPRIRSLALNTILRQLQNTNNSRSARDTMSDEIIQQILESLQHQETEVGAPSVSILSLALEDRLEEPFIKDTLLRMLSSDETVKCRVYELAVNLAKRSPATLQKVEFLLDRALSELDNDDILFQVNILEILVPLAEQNHGLLYLEKRQVFEVISKRVENLDQNPLDRLLLPGIMKFFGKIASIQPQKIILGYPYMIQCLFECIHSGDTTILPVAFDTLANLTKSQQGKLLLNTNYGTALKDTLETVASHLRNLSSDLKNRAFCMLEIVFSCEGTTSADVSKILQQWFVWLANGTNMQFLMDFCRNPFPEIKVACLSFIKTLCTHAWGIVALKNTAGFVEYLLDRKIEFDKDAKYIKFEVIKLLSESNVFDVQTSLQLRTYVNEGPYFVQTMMDIAVEGN